MYSQNLDALWPHKYPMRDHEMMFFVHIPKTSGTTLINILRRFFPPNAYGSFARDELFRIRPETLEPLRLVRAHCGFDAYRHLGRKPVYVTMLRHPVDRTVSAFCARKRRGMVTSGFDEFVRDQEAEKSDRFVFNKQTYLVAGVSKDDGLPGRSVLALAKARLDEFAFFGIVERFADTVKLLASTFDWPPIQGYTSRNVTPASARPLLTARMRDQLLSLNELDVELYEHAVSIFQRRCQCMKLSKFQTT